MGWHERSILAHGLEQLLSFVPYMYGQVHFSSCGALAAANHRKHLVTVLELTGAYDSNDLSLMESHIIFLDADDAGSDSSGCQADQLQVRAKLSDTRTSHSHQQQQI